MQVKINIDLESIEFFLDEDVYRVMEIIHTAPEGSLFEKLEKQFGKGQGSKILNLVKILEDLTEMLIDEDSVELASPTSLKMVN